MGMALLRRSQRGMSLVELLVAMAILAVVMLSVIGLFTQSISLNASGMDYSRINDLARDRLEGLLGCRYDSGELTVPAGLTVAEFPNDIDQASADRLLDRTYKVEELNLSKTGDDATTDLSTPVAGGTGRLKAITVTVASGRTFLSGSREIEVTALKVDGLRY